MDLLGVEVSGVEMDVDVEVRGLLEMVVVLLVLVVKEEVVMEWLALLCLPRTLGLSLLSLSSSLLLSIAGSPGLPSLSLRSRLANTGALGGGWVWMSGSTYPTPGPPTLSSMSSSSKSSTTQPCPSSSPRVMTSGSARVAAKSSLDASKNRTSSSSDSCSSDVTVP